MDGTGWGDSVTLNFDDGAASAIGGRLARRTLDVAVSATLAVLTLPVLVVVLLVSTVTLRAWPLFAQERIGRDGRSLRFLKVRTLPTTVPRYTDKLALEGHRIPRPCLLLRRLHLDELPQLYLVLAGRMSLVGPRPEMRFLHEQLPTSFAAERTAVRPGCTGLWQVSESCSGMISDAPEYDRFYLRHRSFRLDLWILYRTALKMTGIASAISLDDVPSWASEAEPDAVRATEPRDDTVTTIDLRSTAGTDGVLDAIAPSASSA